MGNPNPKTENLKPFKKGHEKVGGRKRGTPNVASDLQKVANVNFLHKNPLTHEKEKRKVFRWINIALVDQAMNGNMRAIEIFYDRLIGKVPNEIKGKMDVGLTIEELEKLSDEELRKIAYGDP